MEYPRHCIGQTHVSIKKYEKLTKPVNDLTVQNRTLQKNHGLYFCFRL